MDNVILCQEVVHGYSRNVISPCMFLKIDTRKEFDSVSWAFLESLLLNLKFPPLFVK